MMNCGWSWGEMGKEGLRALESLDNMTNGHCELYVITYPISPHLNPHPSLPTTFT